MSCTIRIKLGPSSCRPVSGRPISLTTTLGADSGPGWAADLEIGGEQMMLLSKFPSLLVKKNTYYPTTLRTAAFPPS